MLKRPFLIAIFLYKRLISPFLPQGCRFYPTCSDYAYGALSRHGLLKGSALAAKRLLKCQPLYPGGFDPVPESFGIFKKDNEKGVV